MNRRSFFASLAAAFAAPKVVADVVTKTIPYANEVLIFGSDHLMFVTSWNGRIVMVGADRVTQNWFTSASCDPKDFNPALALPKKTPYSL